MNAPFPPHLMEKGRLCRLASAWSLRLIPDQRTPHGFYDPEGFVRSCKRNAARNALRRGMICGLFEVHGLAQALAGERKAA